jgi:uncharacterized membrane protein YhhN
MNRHIFTFFYFTLGILFIFLEYQNTLITALTVKALLMPSLAIFFYSGVKRNFQLLHKLVITGLIFSWLGDLSLQLANDKWESLLSPDKMFIIGLGSFLIAHVFYIFAFNLPVGKNTVLTSRIYMTILVIAYGIILIRLLYTNLGDMMIPVILYAIVILLMLLSALNRYGKVNKVSYVLVAIGALLFVISDSMIAINKFHMKFDYARILIMITYITAQFLIVSGCILQDRQKLNSQQNWSSTINYH